MRKRIFYLLLIILCATQLAFAQSFKKHPNLKKSKPLETMPLSEIRSGMTGYGLTVFKGTEPEKFYFRVIGIDKNDGKFLPLILVDIFGGPNNLLQRSRAIQGMSGSPMFVIQNKRAKLIGALGYASSWSNDKFSYVTPIENILNFYPNILKQPDPNLVFEKTEESRNQLKPGDAYEILIIWGDEFEGVSGTIAFVNEKLAYGMGHNALTWGTVALPVFKAEVLASENKQDSSRKITQPIGKAVGSVILDYKYGQLIQQKVVPRSIPIKITLCNVLPKPLESKLFMAYTSVALTPLQGLFIEMLSENLGPYLSSKTEITLDIEGWPPLEMCGESKATIDSLFALLSKLFLEYENRIPKINSLAVKIIADERTDQTDEFILLDSKLKKSPDEKKFLSLLAQCSRDKAVMQKTVPLDIETYTANPTNLVLALSDGNSLQAELLEKGSIKECWNYLLPLKDRNSLYLAQTSSPTQIETEKPINDQWQILPNFSQFKILKKIDPGIPIKGKVVLVTEEVKKQ